VAILPPAEDALGIGELLLPAVNRFCLRDSRRLVQYLKARPFLPANSHGDHQQPRNTVRHVAPVPTRTHHAILPILARDAIISIVSDRVPPRVDRLLTADELAERLGMKTEWVWAQARAGRIPHVRLGRYRRFRESAVEEWLRELESGGIARASSQRSRPIPLRRRA
jgi:excisionase family DNA binding protein